MSRIDLYATVHKAIRAALVQAAALAGRTDFARADEAEQAADVARTLIDHLEDHARNEDGKIMPVLARVAPEVHADLQADHARTDGLQREVVAIADRVRGASEAERPALGRRLHDRLWHLAAEHLLHMEREETEGMRALWAHCSDEELAGVFGRIVTSIPPDTLAELASILLPAVSLPERAGMLGALSRTIPRPAFETLLGPARAALGDRWPETAAAVGL
jgi:hypothetical protein